MWRMYFIPSEAGKHTVAASADIVSMERSRPNKACLAPIDLAISIAGRSGAEGANSVAACSVNYCSSQYSPWRLLSSGWFCALSAPIVCLQKTTSRQVPHQSIRPCKTAEVPSPPCRIKRLPLARELHYPTGRLPTGMLRRFLSAPVRRSRHVEEGQHREHPA
jgi:hypothetical protein